MPGWLGSAPPASCPHSRVPATCTGRARDQESPGPPESRTQGVCSRPQLPVALLWTRVAARAWATRAERAVRAPHPQAPGGMRGPLGLVQEQENRPGCVARPPSAQAIKTPRTHRRDLRESFLLRPDRRAARAGALLLPTATQAPTQTLRSSAPLVRGPLRGRGGWGKGGPDPGPLQGAAGPPSRPCGATSSRDAGEAGKARGRGRRGRCRSPRNEQTERPSREGPSLTRGFSAHGSAPGEAGRGRAEDRGRGEPTEGTQQSRECALSERRSPRCFLARGTRPASRTAAGPGGRPLASGPALRAARGRRPSQTYRERAQHVRARRRTRRHTCHLRARARLPAARLTSPSRGSAPPGLRPRRPRRGPRRHTAPP